MATVFGPESVSTMTRPSADDQPEAGIPSLATLKQAENIEAVSRAVAHVVREFLREYARGRDPWDEYPPVLDSGHVAKLLGVSLSAVCTAARKGDLPMKQVCGRWRVDKEALREFLGRKAQEPRAPGRRA